MQDARPEITFLGTSSAIPGGGHDTASSLIDGKYLVDTGWNAPIRMRLYGFDPMQLEYLFLTHCHQDHYMALPQLLFYLRLRAFENPNRPPLKIVGPAEDLERVVALARQFLQMDNFPVMDYRPELFPLNAGDAFETDSYHITTCSTLHPVPGRCYRFTHKATGVEFAITGDTAYYPPLIEHVRGVALLVTEASYGANPAPEKNSNLHSGAPEATELASQAGVGRLALMHCAEENQAAAIAAAQARFPNAFWPQDGEKVRL